MIIGIDPGMKTGVAVFEEGELKSLHTFKPFDAIGFVSDLVDDNQVFAIFIEDSRKQSHVWSAKSDASTSSGLKIARNVGMIDGFCTIFEQAFSEAKFHGLLRLVSPLGKGSKVDTKYFRALTKWIGSCNEHERDAALLAWPYRHKKT